MSSRDVCVCVVCNCAEHECTECYQAWSGRVHDSGAPWYSACCQRCSHQYQWHGEQQQHTGEGSMAVSLCYDRESVSCGLHVLATGERRATIRWNQGKGRARRAVRWGVHCDWLVVWSESCCTCGLCRVDGLRQVCDTATHVENMCWYLLHNTRWYATPPTTTHCTIVCYSPTGHAAQFLEWSRTFDLPASQDAISHLLVDSPDVRQLHAELVSVVNMGSQLPSHLQLYCRDAGSCQSVLWSILAPLLLPSTSTWAGKWPTGCQYYAVLFLHTGACSQSSNNG